MKLLLTRALSCSRLAAVPRLGGAIAVHAKMRMSFPPELDRMYVKGIRYLAGSQNELRGLGQRRTGANRRWWGSAC